MSDADDFKKAFQAAPARAIFERQLRMRAERLVRILKLDAPGDIVKEELRLVMRTGFALFPETLGEEIAKVMNRDARFYMRICSDCDKKLEPGHGPLCISCVEKEKKELEADDIEDAMDEKKHEGPEEH